jgi:hypothetical protein
LDGIVWLVRRNAILSIQCSEKCKTLSLKIERLHNLFSENLLTCRNVPVSIAHLAICGDNTFRGDHLVSKSRSDIMARAIPPLFMMGTKKRSSGRFREFSQIFQQVGDVT